MIMRMMLLLLLVLLAHVLAAASSSSSSSSSAAAAAAAASASTVLLSCEREAQQSQACRNELVAQTNPGGPLPQGFEYLSGEALRNRCLELTTVFTQCRDQNIHTNKLSHQQHARPPPSAVQSSIDPIQIPRNKETNNHRKNSNNQRRQQKWQRQQQQQRHRGPVTMEDIQQMQVFDPMKIMLLGVCVLSWLAHAMGWLQQYEITTDHNSSGGGGDGGTDTNSNPGTTTTVLPSSPASSPSPHIRKENSNNNNSSNTIQQQGDTTHKKLL